MQTELDVLRDISQRLDNIGIPYMVSGSMAMNYYATPRMTRDIDIVVAIAPAQTDQLVAALSPDYYVSADAAKEAAQKRKMFNALHNTAVVKIDFIVQKAEPYRQIEFNRRKRVTVDAFQTWLVSKEDLIISKLCWARESGSETQLQDVRNLVASGYEKEYTEQWVNNLGLLEHWRRV